MSEIIVLAFAPLDEIGKLGSKQLSGHLGGGKCPGSMRNDNGTEEPSDERFRICLWHKISRLALDTSSRTLRTLKTGVVITGFETGLRQAVI